MRPTTADRGSRQDGAVAVEHVGVVVVVAAVVAAVLALAPAVRSTIVSTGETALCQLFGGGCEVDLAGDAAGDGADPLDPLDVVTAHPSDVLRAVADVEGPGGVETLLAGVDPGRLTLLRTEAARLAEDPDADPDARAGAIRLRLHDEATRLAADPDVADLAVWEEHLAARAAAADPTAEAEARAAALERLAGTGALVDAARDGSLLAGLRDTEAEVGPGATDEEIARLRDVVERRTRAEHAADLAPRLADWADSGRTFLHAEVDLDDGTVRLAELVHGDLATADHVAVTVPGTGNDASTFDGGVAGDARELANELTVLGEDDTAVVACLCYAPPPDLLHAARSGHADRGGPDLARIVGGLPVAGDADVRALGHSYGSTALGRAVERNGLELAAVVSLGGPGFGSGVREVDDLPATAGEVWAVRHDQDPIALAGMHGVNPDRDRFGARGFGVGDGDLERTWWKPYRVEAHGLYYRDAESLANLALLSSGRGDEVSGHREGRR